MVLSELEEGETQLGSFQTGSIPDSRAPASHLTHECKGRQYLKWQGRAYHPGVSLGAHTIVIMRKLRIRRFVFMFYFYVWSRGCACVCDSFQSLSSLLFKTYLFVCLCARVCVCTCVCVCVHTLHVQRPN